MKRTSPLYALLVLILGIMAITTSGCRTIEGGKDPQFYRGEIVEERLSGRKGIVSNGRWNMVSRVWMYEVVFNPSSIYTRNEQRSDYVNQNRVWLASYELQLPKDNEK